MTETSLRPFKILALDGGGYKGLYTACVLNEIEKFNKPLARYFDLIAGTSVGGLIALALAAGKSTEEIKTFFLDRGEEIFPQRSWLARKGRSIRHWLWRGKYQDTGLRAALEGILGTTTMRDANSYLCIPTVNLPTLSPFVFKTDHDPFLTRDSNVLMADVARATSAAPTYLPIAEITAFPGHQFVDGGLWANNPSLVGLVEAFRFFVGPQKPYGAVKLLSVGSVDDAKPRSITRPRELSILRGGKEILIATLAAQERAVALQVNFLKDALCAPVEYTRIPSPSISPDHFPDIGLDVVNETAKETLLMYGLRAGQEWNTKQEVKTFFVEPADPPVFRTTATVE
jgi:uncharacterized protein